MSAAVTAMSAEVTKSARLWQPAPEAVERSRAEAVVAGRIQDRSLDRLRQVATTPGADEATAAQRRDLADRRLDTSEEEQRKAERTSDLLGWIFAGLLLGTGFIGASVMFVIRTSLF